MSIVYLLIGAVIGSCVVVGWLLWHPDKLDKLLRVYSDIRDAWGGKP